MKRIEWTPIREAYLHGLKATAGEKTAEVIRCYSGQWTVFLYINGTMQGPQLDGYLTFTAARKKVKALLTD